MKKQNAMAAIAVEKSLLKEYQTSNCDRTVYLDKDSEFQIKLFNPTNGTIAADVSVNGEPLGKCIVIRPGEIIWLERFLDKARKFKFDVYEVDKSQPGVKEAIRNNGEVKVEFYREYKQHTYFGRTTWISDTPDIYYYNSNNRTNYNPNEHLEIRCSSNCDSSCEAISSTLNLSSMDCCRDITATNYSFGTSASLNQSPKLKKKTIDTGRISEGGYSSQNFKSVGFDSEILPFEAETIKILPKSQKPFTKNDLEKVYCVECGRKIKPRFKYCPFCGAKQ